MVVRASMSLGGRLLRPALIVRRIHLSNLERPQKLDLNNCARLGPSEVVHVRARDAITAGFERFRLLLVELVSHADSQGTRDYRDVLIGGVPMRRDLIARR